MEGGGGARGPPGTRGRGQRGEGDVSGRQEEHQTEEEALLANGKAGGGTKSSHLFNSLSVMGKLW